MLVLASRKDIHGSGKPPMGGKTLPKLPKDGRPEVQCGSDGKAGCARESRPEATGYLLYGSFARFAHAPGPARPLLWTAPNVSLRTFPASRGLFRPQDLTTDHASRGTFCRQAQMPALTSRSTTQPFAVKSAGAPALLSATALKRPSIAARVPENVCRFRVGRPFRRSDV